MDHHDDTLPCAQCGGEVYEDAVRCPHCGSYEATGGRHNARNRFPVWLNWLMVCVLVLALAGILIPLARAMLRGLLGN